MLEHWFFFLQEAIKLKKPSTRREGFSSIPDVKWEDIGGLDSLRQELDDLIVNRIKDPEIYKVICACYTFFISQLLFTLRGSCIR